jgi:hypothetical protein
LIDHALIDAMSLFIAGGSDRGPILVRHSGFFIQIQRLLEIRGSQALALWARLTGLGGLFEFVEAFVNQTPECQEFGGIELSGINE